MGAGRITQHRKTNGDSVLKCFSQVFAVINESAYNSLLAWYLWLCFSKTANTYETEQLILYSCAIFTGILAWDIAMAALASTFRRCLAATFLTAVSVVSGLSLIGFGLYFGWQAAQQLG